MTQDVVLFSSLCESSMVNLKGEWGAVAELTLGARDALAVAHGVLALYDDGV